MRARRRQRRPPRGSKGGRTPPDRIEPVRSCSGCRSRRPQRRLVRVVRTPDGSISIDSAVGARRASGRGAYVCPEAECIEMALKGGLRRTLKHGDILPDDLSERLLREAHQLRSRNQERSEE